MPDLLSFATEFSFQSFSPLFLKENALSLAKLLLGLEDEVLQVKGHFIALWFHLLTYLDALNHQEYELLPDFH